MQHLEIPTEEVLRRLRLDNPWWGSENGMDPYYNSLPRRSYFKQFCDLVVEKDVNRAVVLMGPRRVGKTVMIHHLIGELLGQGIAPETILYISVDTPTYTGFSLEKLLQLFLEHNALERSSECFIFFDEIQYVSSWETHLKSLVDTYRNFTFTASGSAAAALRMKSRESGAGRFTDFMLPPLTFAEFLRLTGKENSLITTHMGGRLPKYTATNIEQLNVAFINYLNYGGYPEAALSKAVQENPSRYIKSDIIDKVLLKDLPSLYGIQNIQELNKLLSTVAYNTGNEVSLDALSQSSGVAKNTIKKYLEYLEAAFLVSLIHRVDDTCRSFTRQNYFKVYLTNPSMRAALFHSIDGESETIGNLAETAIISQWFHPKGDKVRYSRWKGGEVDIVYLDQRSQRPAWCVEIKWSDAYFDTPNKLKSLIRFAKKNGIAGARATSKTKAGITSVNGIIIEHIPTSLYCYTVGRNLTESVI